MNTQQRKQGAIMKQLYSAPVHNEKVRRAVDAGGHYRDLSDAWALTNYLDIEAGDRDEALERLRARFPATRGFVVGPVELCHNHGWAKNSR